MRARDHPMSETITIYGFGDVDRSGKVRWLARELGAKMLPKDGFVAADRFTVADVVTGYGLRLSVRLGLLERAAVEPYFSRLVDRPAATAARFFASLK